MNGDDSLFQVYNQELVALSAQADAPRRLDRPDVSARAVSPVCGSEVALEFKFENGRVTDLGYEVEACALTKSVVAVMKAAAPGKTAREIIRAGRDLATMLSGGPPPGGDWAALKVLLPVQDYKARHDSILLPFAAAEKAFKSAPALTHYDK